MPFFDTMMLQVQVCIYSGDDLASCHELHLDVSELLSSAEQYPRSIVLQAPIQGFSHRGNLYLMTMSTISHNIGDTQESHTAAIMFKLSPSMRNTTSTTLLLCSSSYMVSVVTNCAYVHIYKHAILLQRVPITSWMVLPTWSKLAIVTSISPLVIVVVNESTGKCDVMQREFDTEKAIHNVTAGYLLHGHAPFVNIGLNRFLSVAYRKVPYSFGPIHTQHFVVLQLVDTLWKLQIVSQGFR
jgi:hypothetical protein